MDITIDMNGIIFNSRACGVVINGNKILLHKAKNDDFWTLVGGRIKTGETSEEAVIREFKEELTEEVSIDRLLYTVENFFEFNKITVHEYMFVYLLNMQKSISISDNQIIETPDERLIFKWFNINEISSLNIEPSFLKKELYSIPVNVTHIINKEITVPNNN